MKFFHPLIVDYTSFFVKKKKKKKKKKNSCPTKCSPTMRLGVDNDYSSISRTIRQSQVLGWKVDSLLLGWYQNSLYFYSFLNLVQMLNNFLNG